ncbi:MAG: efflux RND transporter periplasmic adaptor subunit [Acidobacteriota bacterium]
MRASIARVTESVGRAGQWIFAGMALLALSGCGQEAASTQTEPPRPVRVVEAVRSSEAAGQIFSGRIQSAARSRLSFRVPGRILERPVEIGTRLRAGQRIATLDATDYRLRLEQSEAGLERARAELREAEAAYGRVQTLYAGDSATRSDLDRVLAAVERARSAVTEAEKGRDIARRDLGHTRLVAKGEGLVTDLFGEVGENVQAGQAVATVADAAAPLEVEWTVPEALVVTLEEGLEIEVVQPALDLRAKAQVSHVAASPRDGEATYPIVARLIEAGARWRSGMAVEVVLAGTEAARQAILLPPHAVTGDPAGSYVFIVGGSSEPGAGTSDEYRAVQRRPVTLGGLTQHGVEILSGLEGGETVVSAGVSFLDDGMTVRLLRSDPLAEIPSATSTGAAP